MILQHNLPGITSGRNMTKNKVKLSKNLEKLSSGYRINRAGDDAAGLAISEGMRCQIRGIDQAKRNNEPPRGKPSSTVLGSYVAAHSTCLLHLLTHL